MAAARICRRAARCGWCMATTVSTTSSWRPMRRRCCAVLDWELSTLGDPLADFTYHLMQWHMPQSETGAGTGSLVGHDLDALGIPSLRAYVDAYVARTGLDPRPHLPDYLAYNFFRIAAILQGIVGRVRDGTATSEQRARQRPRWCSRWPRSAGGSRARPALRRQPAAFCPPLVGRVATTR